MSLATIVADNETITDADFERFRDFFYRKTGIYFENSKRYFVDKRLISRIQETGHENFRRYFTFLRFQASGEETQKLINIMTVNETYFFREENQFDCMVEELLDKIIKDNGREPIRIWSIPSSTGEEPYSIALYLMERWPEIENIDVEIVSSDIDSKVLAHCKKGVYNQRSIHNLPKDILRKYFKPLKNGYFAIRKDLRESINFTRVNLVEAADTRKYRDFDLIFCRNLLIYFDDISRRQAAEVFYDALKPRGYIFLGHSESMSRISSLFNVCKFSKAIVYQKPG
jgi:chemotaxis protein methyltransferase CheR